MIDWTMISPTYLSNVIDWAEAVVTDFANGPAKPRDNREGADRGRPTC